MYEEIIQLKKENNILKEKVKITKAHNLWIESLNQNEVFFNFNFNLIYRLNTN